MESINWMESIKQIASTETTEEFYYNYFIQLLYSRQSLRVIDYSN